MSNNLSFWIIKTKKGVPFDTFPMNYVFMNSFFAARSVFCSKETRVIGPTPPGTGVMYAHFGETSSNLRLFNLKPDFVSEAGTLVVPTSITTAPSFTIFTFNKFRVNQGRQLKMSACADFIQIFCLAVSNCNGCIHTFCDIKCSRAANDITQANNHAILPEVGILYLFQ